MLTTSPPPPPPILSSVFTSIHSSFYDTASSFNFISLPLIFFSSFPLRSFSSSVWLFVTSSTPADLCCPPPHTHTLFLYFLCPCASFSPTSSVCLCPSICLPLILFHPLIPSIPSPNIFLFSASLLSCEQLLLCGWATALSLSLPMQILHFKLVNFVTQICSVDELQTVLTALMFTLLPTYIEDFHDMRHFNDSADSGVQLKTFCVNVNKVKFYLF